MTGLESSNLTLCQTLEIGEICAGLEVVTLTTEGISLN